MQTGKRFNCQTFCSKLGIPTNYEATRRLPRHEEASELVVADLDPNGIEVLLTPKATRAWQQLKFSAAGEGVQLLLESGFRSYQTQAELIERELAAGRTLTETLTWIAVPGFSEHHSGNALDITTPGHFPVNQDFAKTVAYQWLLANAGNYGFTLSYPPGNPYGIIFEPWHWYLNG